MAPPRVGQSKPAFVRAEIILDSGRLGDNVHREWESLRQEDTIYLCAIQPSGDNHRFTNGHSSLADLCDARLRCLRTAEIVQLQDDRGRSLKENAQGQTNGYYERQRLRRMIVDLDATEYKRDLERKAAGVPDVYESINLVVRRKGRENNSSKVLQSIKCLALSDVPVPTWLQEVFLGYGDPTSASYNQLPTKLDSVDFRDTFLDWQHLIDSFPNKVGPMTGWLKYSTKTCDRL